MKLKDYYKIDHNNKQPIPGSNIRRKSSPGRFWKQILDPCCNPLTVPCTCGPRFFVQIDSRNKPIPGSLIKRFVFPKMEQGINYVELLWQSPCCPDTSCANSTVTSSDPAPEIIIGGRNENYYFTFYCGNTEITVNYGTPGTAQEVAIAVTDLLNAQLLANDITGTFQANPNATITYTGDLCNCADSGPSIDIAQGTGA